MNWKTWGLLFGLSLPTANQAQARGWEAAIGHGAESLTHGQATWRQTDLALRGPVNPYAEVEFNARSTLRYGLRDDEAGLRLSHRLPARWSGSLAFTASPTHRVLARSTWEVEAQRPWGEGWVTGLQARTAQYTDARVNTWTLLQEKYFASGDGAQWRAAAQASVTQLPGAGAGAGAGNGQGWRVALDRTSATQWRVSLILATGREWESTGDASAFAVHRVHGAALTVRLPLAAGWTGMADWSHAEVKGVHRREGARLGVARTF